MKKDKTLKIPKYFSDYLLIAKGSGNNEIYETLILMILNKDFFTEIKEIINENITKTEEYSLNTKDDVRHNIHVINSEKIYPIIDKVCSSVYFKNNFTVLEIKRKREIIYSVIMDLCIRVNYSTLRNNIPKAKKFSFEHDEIATAIEKIKFSCIEHWIKEGSTPKEANKVRIEFYEGTPLNEVIKFMKEQLGMETKQKKYKLTLGPRYRMLQIEREIDSGLIDVKDNFEYKEQPIKREMKKSGWTIEALSHESGVPSSTLREWRNGRVPRHPAQVMALAQVLGLSLVKIYFGGENDE